MATRPLAHLLRPLLLSVALLGPEASHAAEPRAPSAAEIVRPALVAPVEAHYPDEARAAGLEATVRLSLTLDAEGIVRDALVLAPVGHGFDEAALDAAYRLRFSPARRNGAAVGARVLYEHEFRLPPESAPAAASDSPATTEGAPTATGATAVPAPVAQPAPNVAIASEGPSQPEEAAISGTSGDAAQMEVVVHGCTDAENLRQSARAVKVIEVEKARRESADMGQVLAREEGVSVRRSGGLGADTRFSLNGLTGEQVRFFLDGVPLSLAGYPSGIVNVPLNLMERVDVYAGVVPVQFGADALGGAVNLVTDHGTPGFAANGSYQVGSFGTHRVTLAARSLDEPSGLFARIQGFHDQTRNDYDVQVVVSDDLGREYGATVPRFHDAYRATGGSLEFGVVNRPYAKRLLARVFVSDYDKEAQNNFTMTVPYGGITYGATSYGGSLHYTNDVSDDVSVDLLAGYTKNVVSYQDVSTCFYDWFGRCIDPNHPAGELEGQPHDQLHYEDAVLGRANLTWQALPTHQVRLSVAPTHVRRIGEERRLPSPDSPDPLAEQRNLTSLVSGVEWETDPFADVLKNIAFAKSYAQWLRSEERVSGGPLRDVERDTLEEGIGDSLRVRATDQLYFKASYEYATRLPSPDQLFGDGTFVVQNLDLSPERSHNGNLGAYYEAEERAFGAYSASANGFVRDTHDEIVLTGDDRKQVYENVRTARCLGVEGVLGWTSPRRYVALDGNVTYQDLRNKSEDGAFKLYYGDRLPNRPYLFANGSATLQAPRVFAPRGVLSLTWYTSYVHSFFRGWESIGLRDTKQVIDAQLVHSLALTHTLTARAAKVSSTFEIDNLTNAKAFDFFGVQKPGRAFNVKTTLDL